MSRQNNIVCGGSWLFEHHEFISDEDKILFGTVGTNDEKQRDRRGWQLVILPILFCTVGTNNENQEIEEDGNWLFFNDNIFLIKQC